MAQYFYTAQSPEGEKKTGTLEAKDEHQLAKILRQEGYILISATVEREKVKKEFKISLPFFGKVSLTEKLFFTRNLEVMISAGIPLPRGLRILSAQTKNKKLRNALLDIAEEINKGKSFSDSLFKYPNIFSEIFSSMVKVGEEAGTLEEVLKVLTRQMEKQHELQSKITGALVYPAVIILAMMGIGILMLITVVPKLSETFKELGIALPPATKLVIALGNFLASFWYLLPLIVLCFAIILKLLLKTKIGKKAFDSLCLKVPVVSPIVKKTNSAQTIRTLSSLISSGVPIVRSLEITAGALGNIYYKKAISEASERVGKGEKLSEVLRPYQNIYPLIVIQMLEVGEETGETSSILAKLADFFEEEVGNSTKNLTAVIEPVLMVIIGGVVGFFAIAMVQPMYSMLETL